MTKEKKDNNKVYPQELNLNYVFKDLSGEALPGIRVIKNEDGTDSGKRESLTLKDTLTEALSMPDQQNQKPTNGMEKMKRLKLARRVYDSDSIMLTSEEVTLLKELVNARFSAPLVVGQAIEQLDPVASEKV